MVVKGEGEACERERGREFRKEGFEGGVETLEGFVRTGDNWVVRFFRINWVLR